jgi:hypothetical protein
MLGIYSVPVVSFICSSAQLAILLAFWRKITYIRDFAAGFAVLAVLAPLGLCLARFFEGWLLEASLLYLIGYSALFSALFFWLAVFLQNLMGSKSSSYIIFLFKERLIMRYVNKRKKV